MRCIEGTIDWFWFDWFWFWFWTGSLQDVDFGRMFSREFVDSNEEKNSAEGQMNLHNNEAGRRVREPTWRLMLAVLHS